MRGWIHLSLLAFIALLFSVDFNAAEGIFGDEVERGDEYIDKILKDMTEENGHEYDPYPLEDSQVGFSKKIAFVNVSGEAKLHNGHITGFKSLHRPDHCSVEEKDGKLYVNADLGAGVMNFHYDGTVKFMNFGPTISAHGELAYLEIHMEFAVDSKTGKDGELLKFVITDMKGMNIKITGLGPMNWALNYLVNGITSLFQGFVKGMVERTVTNHLKERLPNYQFPVDDPVTPQTETPEVLPETSAPEVDSETPEPEVDSETPEPEVDPETSEPDVVSETPEPEVVPETLEPEVLESLEAMKVLNYLAL